jgi:hypothetical protein
MQTTVKSGVYIIRVTVRDAENTKFVYLVPTVEQRKIPDALKRLKSGSQAKSLTFSALSMDDTKRLVGLIGGL